MRNAESTIARCISSVNNQTYTNIEYIVIDGASTDSTVNIINQYKEHINIFISEPDKGIYDAMNKGIAMATGDVVGILNADDVYADVGILHDVAVFFTLSDIPVLYGDLDFVDKRGKITRKWRAGAYKYGLFNKGWMPPHPTFYCRRDLFDRYGYYNLQFGTAGDYELMVRYLHLNKLSAGYLNKIMVKMNKGGVSNKTYLNHVKGLMHDYKAMRLNAIKFPLITILMKPLRKIMQFIK